MSKDLSYTVNNETFYLPTWCESWSDEDIEKAKQSFIEEELNRKPLTEEEIDAIVAAEEAEIDRLVKKVKPQLKKEGFNNSQIETIVADLYAGRTLDSAMQQFA